MNERERCGSGMCRDCSVQCVGGCEVARAALRGASALYPEDVGQYQFSSGKRYPVELADIQINGHVFGANGFPGSPADISAPSIDLSAPISDIPCTMPIILPAIAKLNWADYYAGAALAGVVATIGEAVVGKDPDARWHDGRITASPLLCRMRDAYRQFAHNSTDIVLQANVDDCRYGVLEYAVAELGISSVELKFGQASKGIQHMHTVDTLEAALLAARQGLLVSPDPESAAVQSAWHSGSVARFWVSSRLPVWTEETLEKTLIRLRELGAKQIFFKMGGYDPCDLERVLRIAAAQKVALVTFDGAGGGTGCSPCRMMDEWGRPAVYLLCALVKIADKLTAQGIALPQLAIAGRFASEDQVFKGLALGAPYVTHVAIGRAAMAAATVASNVGQAINAGKLPHAVSKYGVTSDEIFWARQQLRAAYGNNAAITDGAVGVYSYLDKIAMGLRQFMALNRKFSLSALSREDVFPLTTDARSLMENGTL
ncbi:MAG: glutamate synthase-related protein [Eubacteriales bacterium]|nr:glutamate synthase-related protein [Eubacteriales bacterium]